MSRSTGDAVVLVFVVAAATILVVATVALSVIEIRDPSTDTFPAWEIIGGIFATLVGAATGYALGTRGRRDRRE